MEEKISELSSFSENEEVVSPSESGESGEVEADETEKQVDTVADNEQQSEALPPNKGLEEKDNQTPCELSEIKNLLSELSSQFESKLKYDKHKDEIIDKLHAENQAYKNDLLKKIVMPFVNEIIFLIDDYSNLLKKYTETDISEIDTTKLLKQFGNIPDDLEELLNKNGIESFNVEGEVIDFAKQKVIKTVSTNIPEKDKTVCDQIKKGFIMDGKIIRQEFVSCYKFENEIINN
ncbi:MAG: nucleotide exchange factor GrpE [Tannerellaceae bacterium]|jgi:molecular chaperone GrpE|nr:nucleotide exchange factor GrpE [Tannerellaceae bacterium]